MMFLVTWQPLAFARMQTLLLDHPELKTEFIFDLRSLATELNRSADEWGESRDDPYRLGFLSEVQVLVRIDLDDSVAEVVDVKLRRRVSTG